MKPIKERITDYWSRRAEGFETQRIREFGSEKRKRWLDEIIPCLPAGRPLKILDIGTGTGFFACLLALEGHETVGIDLTPEMIRHARHMAEELGIKADFRVMDAEMPEFGEASFDALVTRNLTWTLPHADRAYREWYKLLKPGGVLINFDADYYAALGTNEERTLPKSHAHMLLPESMSIENDSITREIGANEQPRPGWDVQLLAEAGFQRIITDMGVYRRIYDRIDEFYNPVPIFMITAYK